MQQDLVTLRETAEESLGEKLKCAELKEVGIPNTLEYLLYSDKDQNETIFPDLDEEVTPEVGDEYVHALVMLPCGSQLIHGTMKARKRDLDGNPIGHQLDNPLLDMQLYDVKFPNGEVTPLTANAIAQAMYAQLTLMGMSTCYLSALSMYKRTIPP